MFYTFQESLIMTAGNPVDPEGRRVRIKAKDHIRARKRLPETSFGRTWILVKTEAASTQPKR